MKKVFPFFLLLFIVNVNAISFSPIETHLVDKILIHSENVNQLSINKYENDVIIRDNVKIYIEPVTITYSLPKRRTITDSSSYISSNTISLGTEGLPLNARHLFYNNQNPIQLRNISKENIFDLVNTDFSTLEINYFNIDNSKLYK